MSQINLKDLKKLPRSTPEDQQISSQAIEALVNAFERNELELHSLMILRHGHVVAEGWWSPYHSEHLHLLNSLSKSFTSTAIGLAVAEGRLTIDDAVVGFFPEYVNEAIAANMADLKVRHLLSMSTGHDVDTMPLMGGSSEDWANTFLHIPITHAPGTHFLYNTGATYMLSAILHKITGISLLDYLEPRLFEPLGITDVTWVSSPQGIHAGGFGMSLNTEDIAKFGQLYLQKGLWNGQRILSEAWIEDATAQHIATGDNPESDWTQGYGFQFWRCRHGAYRADGAYGQFCVVLPEQDAVIAITSGLEDLQGVLDVVWEHLLPAFSEGELRANHVAQEKLVHRLQSLSYEPPIVSASSSLANELSGKRYSLADNEVEVKAVSFRFEEQEGTLTIWGEQAQQILRYGIGKWTEGEITLFGSPLLIAASGTWTETHVFELTIRFLEYSYWDTWSFHFIGDRIEILTSRNIEINPGLAGSELLHKLSGEVERR